MLFLWCLKEKVKILHTQMEKFEQLKQVIANIEPDFEKFYGKGVKAASPRIRKAMQEIKSLAQEIRVEVQEERNRLDAE